jgi:hypothetical protein
MLYTPTRSVLATLNKPKGKYSDQEYHFGELHDLRMIVIAT